MNKAVKQCVLGIAGYFFLFQGMMGFINTFFLSGLQFFFSRFFFDGFSNLIPIITQAIPNLLIIAISLFLIFYSHKMERTSNEGDTSSKPQIKNIVGNTVGVLILLYSGLRIITSLFTQLSTYLSIKQATKIITQQQRDIILDNAIGNIPFLILYLAGIVTGVVILFQTKKKYGQNDGTT